MSAMQDVSWSELLQRPKDTVAKLEGARRRALRVHRRDAEDLVLTTASRASQDSEMVDLATRMFVVVMSDPTTRSRHLVDILPKIFPWVRFLPDDDKVAFIQELVDALIVCGDLDTPAPVLQVVTEWRHAAEVHADPDLAAILRHRVTSDLGPVPAPAG